MPKYKTHLVGGFSTFILIIFFGVQLNSLKELSWQQFLVGLFLCLVGSLFPDIDTNSVIQKILYLSLFPAIFIALFSKSWGLFFLFSLIAIAPLFTRHRGITHRAWFILAIPLILAIFLGCNTKASKTFLIYYLCFTAGALSHLILDFGVKKAFFRSGFNKKY
jgi:hypothetical protein